MPSSFYFGCVAPAVPENADQVPITCDVALAGFKGKDNQVSAAAQVCAQTFSFNPTSSLGPQQLAFASPLAGCFKDVQFVWFQCSLQGGVSRLDSDASMVLDDVKYAYTACS